MALAFQRVLLKLSGEALSAGTGFGVDVKRVHEIAGELAEAQALGAQIAIVVGGGNFFRGVAEPFIRRRALRHLEKGRVVIFAAGTGNPYFSTDSAASLRAMEIKADVVMKATKVDGIYDADPVVVKDAKMFDHITYLDVLKKGLKVMDATAIALCRENNLPIVIFNLNKPGNIKRVLTGEKVGSLVSA